MLLLVFLFCALSVSNGGARAQSKENPPSDLQVKASREAAFGSYSEACKLYTQALKLLLAKREEAEGGAVYIKLGEINQMHGAFSLAEVNYNSGLDLLKRYAKPNDFRLVIALDDLGWLDIMWGRLMEGSRLLDQARMKAEEAPPNDPRLIGHLDTQAAYLTTTGKYSEARKLWTRALEIGKLNYGPDQPEYNDILLHLGQAVALSGDYQTAVDMFRQYLGVQARMPVLPTLSRAVALAELGRVYARLHKFGEARSWFDQALWTLKGNPDGAPLIQSLVFCYLGDFYMDQGDWWNAQSEYREALRIQQIVLGENRTVASSMLLLAKALRKLHLKGQAKDLEAHANAIIAAAAENPARGQTVDVVALRRQ